MAVYTELPREIISQLISEYYGLGTLVSAFGIAQGVENSNYLLVTANTQGEETRYILTIYEKRMLPEDLPFFMELMQHISQKGLASPRPVAAKDGALSGVLNGKHFALITFLPGISASVITANHAAEVGRALAGLHLATADFAKTRANTLSLASWRHMSENLDKKLDQVGDGLHALIQNELAFLSAHWPKDLPTGIIHADLFPDNVFFDAHQHLSGMIDFYFACEDFLAYDLAVTLNAWCFAHGRMDMEKARVMVQAYQALRPLTAQELENLPILLRGAALRFLLTRAYDWVHQAQQAAGSPKNPLEYVEILQFHRAVGDVSAYGWA